MKEDVEVKFPLCGCDSERVRLCETERAAGLLSVHFCSTAGDPVIISQPASNVPIVVAPSGEVVSSSGKVGSVLSRLLLGAALLTRLTLQRRFSLCFQSRSQFSTSVQNLHFSTQLTGEIRERT